MPKKKSVSKASFVRSLPSDLPAKAVLAEAKKQGITISEAHVYGIRAAAKKKGKRSNGAKREPGRPSARAAVENHFLSLVLDVGLVRAQALLSEVKTLVGV